MINECVLGFASLSSIDIVAAETSVAPESTADNSAPVGGGDVSIPDSPADVVISTDVAAEVSTASSEEATTAFENTTTDIVEESTESLESVSNNEVFTNGSVSSSTADYTALVEVVSLADSNNVELLTQIDYRLCAIIFLLLLFWSVDRIKKIVRGFEVRGKHGKSDL